MVRKAKKHIGSCGIYVVVARVDDTPLLLVHRRSSRVTDPHTIASPGGIVEKAMCVPPGNTQGCLDFERGALKTALRELDEEAGVELNHCVEGPQAAPRELGLQLGRAMAQELLRGAFSIPRREGPFQVQRARGCVQRYDRCGLAVG